MNVEKKEKTYQHLCYAYSNKFSVTLLIKLNIFNLNSDFMIFM